MQAAPGQPDPPTFHRQLTNAVHAFTDRFGRPPRFAAVAPGRVNLIGEHTDYNAGYVLPLAIDRWAVIVADLTPQAQSTLWTIDLDETVVVDLTGPLSPRSAGFANYLLGVVDQFAGRKHGVPNLDLALTSTVPRGAGLAGSAAIEVAMATLLEQIVGVRLDPLDKAALCQRAEHDFAGTPCGIMDMFIATHATPGRALLIDCRIHTARPISMPPPEQVTVLVADTHIQHDLAHSAYADRRSTCEQAAMKLGLSALRDADLTMLDTADLSEQQRRRARHVICENQRVRSAAAALESEDLDTLGQLMFDSHASLRDLYEVSCPELDTLVDAAGELRGEEGVIGARMTGAGFGGCAVVLCRPTAAEEVMKGLQRRYAERGGRAATLFPVSAVGAAHAVPLSD